MMVGAFGGEKPADQEVNALFGTAEVAHAVGEKLGEVVSSLIVDGYKTQVVAGLNYKVRATVNGDKKVVITAYKPLPHTGKPLEVTSVEVGHSEL